MVSEVNGPPTGTVYLPETRSQALDGVQTRKAETQHVAGVTAPSDTVVFTETAEQLRALESFLARVPEVDRQRVEAIKRAIADGTYEVHPDRIAERLVEWEAILSGKRDG